MLKIRKKLNFSIKRVLVGLIFQFFAVFTITFLKGPTFRPKQHPKTKIAFINQTWYLTGWHLQIFFLKSCQESRINTHFANFRHLVPAAVEFPWNDPKLNIGFMMIKKSYARKARVNLPHIGNRKCIKFVLHQNLLDKTPGLTFPSRNLYGRYPKDVKFQNSEIFTPGPQ
jgi:hypothetical protein